MGGLFRSQIVRFRGIFRAAFWRLPAAKKDTPDREFDPEQYRKM
jgi:hypothetical protein